MRFKKFAQLHEQGKQIFLNPNFCPFLLLIYNKEAGKNFSYSDTLNEINFSFCAFNKAGA